MDILNNTNTMLGIAASCLTIIAIVIPALVRPRKSTPSPVSQIEQSQTLSPSLPQQPIPLTSRVLASIFGIIVGVVVFAIALILLSVIENFILANRSFPNWLVIILNVFVFLLPTLLGIFIAIVMGERYLEMRRVRSEFEETSRRQRLEFEESVRRDQTRMEEFHNRFNIPRNSNESRSDR